MLPSFCNETIKVLRAPIVTERGSKIRDWSNPEIYEVSGCSVQIASSENVFNQRDNTDEVYSLFAPFDSDIQETDRIVWNGKTFVVSNMPYVWKSPTGAVTHLNCQIERWVG